MPQALAIGRANHGGQACAKDKPPQKSAFAPTQLPKQAKLAPHISICGAIYLIHDTGYAAVLMTRKSTIQSSIPPVRPYAKTDAYGSCDRAPSEAAKPIDSEISAGQARLGGIESLVPRQLAPWVENLQAADLEAVRILSRTAHSSVGRLAAIGISKLGNGWVYILLAAMIFAHWGVSGYKVVLFASVNALVTHCLYPLIKRRYRRRRPFKVDPELASLLATLDEHSFPSGHTMTLSAVLTPIVMLWPSLLIPAVLMVLCVAWSRIATAHHYPSDVLAGAMLGISVGYPISLAAISIW